MSRGRERYEIGRVLIIRNAHGLVLVALGSGHPGWPSAFLHCANCGSRASPSKETMVN